MNYKTYAQRMAIEKSNKQRWLKVCPTLTEESGIYIMTRRGEDGFDYAYVGQAKHLLTRLAQHLQGYQAIDLSLKKHKLYSKDNPNGWSVDVFECPLADLDEREREWIKDCVRNGYILKNITSGGQDNGKGDINQRRPTKGYRQGVEYGYNKCLDEIGKLVRRSLCVEINGKETAQKLKDYYKVCEMLQIAVVDKLTPTDEGEI